jgi:hypothetical protein
MTPATTPPNASRAGPNPASRPDRLIIKVKTPIGVLAQRWRESGRSRPTPWTTTMRKKRAFRWWNGERFLEGHTGAEKINLGALCNVLRQFHFHVVAASPTIRTGPVLPPGRVIPSLPSSGFQILGSLMIRRTIDAAVRKSKITAGC